MKNNEIFFKMFTLTLVVAAVVCLIVDFVINKQLTWAAYSVLSIVFGWAVLSPLFLKKHEIILSLCALTLLVLPYLYLLSKFTPVTDWFMPIGLPAGIAGVIALWLLYPLYRFAKMNIWWKSAITVFLLGVLVSPAVNYFVDIYLKTEPFIWYRFLNVFACAAATVALGVLGYRKRPKSKPDNDCTNGTLL